MFVVVVLVVVVVRNDGGPLVPTYGTDSQTTKKTDCVHVGSFVFCRCSVFINDKKITINNNNNKKTSLRCCL